MYLLPTACTDASLGSCLVILEASIMKSETKINDPVLQELNKSGIDTLLMISS